MTTDSPGPDNLFAAVDRLAEEVKAEVKTQVAEPTPNPPSPPPPLSVEVQPAQSDTPVYIEPKADLIYGATGSGKTVNIGRVSDYVLAKYGKLTRMTSADGGGLGPISGKAASGQIEFWGIAAWPRPIEAMYKAVRGWWPLRVDDPESPIVPPDAGTWEVYGFGAFEGLTSWGDKIIEVLKAKKASLSQDPSYTWREGDVEFSGGNMTYFGFAQDQLQSFVGISHILGYEKIIWTGQESRGDDQSGAKVFGPAIAGKKATGRAGGWFLNVWHMDILPTGNQVKDTVTGEIIPEVKHVLFLKTHVDPLTLVPFPCKFRNPIEELNKVPTYLLSGDAAEAYKLLDEMYERQKLSSRSNLDKIKGLREKLLERAAVAKKKEAAEAEKRAKAVNLLKPMVTVPSPIVASTSTVGKPAAPVAPAAPATPSVVVAPKLVAPVAPVAPTAPSPIPTGIPRIQNIRKGK